MHKMRIIVNLFVVLGWLATTAFQPLPPAESAASTLPADFSPTAIPADFGKTAPSDGSSNLLPAGVVLEWDASSPGVSYQYCLRPSKTSCPGPKWVAVGANTSVTLQGLTPGAKYFWQVRAVNASGTTEADGGLWWSFTIQSSTVLPGPFGKLTPADASLNAPVTGLGLSWGASSGATRYEYCYDTLNNNLCDQTWVNTASATSASLSGLAYNTLYYWQVRAVNSFGNVQADSGIWWTFWTRTAPPGAFSKLLPANGATGQPVSLTLSWEASSGPSATYEYCYDKTQGSTCTSSGPWTSVGSSTSASISSGLSYATTYYWQVRATSGSTVTLANDGAYWSFSTRIAPPDNFGKSSPGIDALDQPLNPTLTWGVSTGANVTYEYCYSKADIINNACDGVWYLAGTNTSAGLSGLSNNTLYYWQVRAVNTSGETYANSGVPWHFTTQISAPWAFNKISPSTGTTGVPLNVNLEWSPSAGAERYFYCVDEEAINNNICDTGWVLNNSSTTVVPPALATGHTYYWQVYAENSQGSIQADDSAWWSFSTIQTIPSDFSKISPMDVTANHPLSPWLYWSQSVDALSYDYCITTTFATPLTCDTGWKPVTPPPAGLYPSFNLAGPLSYNTTYYWQVRAVNSGGTTEANLDVWWSFTTVKTPPVVNDLVNQAFQTNEDAPLTAALTATSNYGKTFTLVGSQPAGTLIFHSDGGFTYTPVPDFNGLVSFQFVVADGYNPPTAPHTATITVKPVNDPPVLALIPDQVVKTGTQVTFTAVATDADLPYGDALTYSILEPLPTGATFNPATGFFSWVPKWSLPQPGVFTFTVMVTDEGIPLPPISAQQVVQITVDPEVVFVPVIFR